MIGLSYDEKQLVIKIRNDVYQEVNHNKKNKNEKMHLKIARITKLERYLVLGQAIVLLSAVFHYIIREYISKGSINDMYLDENVAMIFVGCLDMFINLVGNPENERTESQEKENRFKSRNFKGALIQLVMGALCLGISWKTWHQFDTKQEYAEYRQGSFLDSVYFTSAGFTLLYCAFINVFPSCTQEDRRDDTTTMGSHRCLNGCQGCSFSSVLIFKSFWCYRQINRESFPQANQRIYDICPYYKEQFPDGLDKNYNLDVLNHCIVDIQLENGTDYTDMYKEQNDQLFYNMYFIFGTLIVLSFVIEQIVNMYLIDDMNSWDRKKFDDWDKACYFLYNPMFWVLSIIILTTGLIEILYVKCHVQEYNQVQCDDNKILMLTLSIMAVSVIIADIIKTVEHSRTLKKLCCDEDKPWKARIQENNVDSDESLDYDKTDEIKYTHDGTKIEKGLGFSKEKYALL